jgi:hypothetical protein
MQLRWLAALVVATLVAGASRTALAYPEFQLATGNGRCSLCHISPTGGGLINAYGRSESSATISQFGGNGDFLYGVYKEPEWVKLGVDLRGAFLAKKQVDDPEYYLFPMQGDTYAWFGAGDFSLYGAVGPRAQVRPERDTVLGRMGAREYWVMWRPDTSGPYARAGRFLMPFGLRSPDHRMYVRRDLGLGTWEETYNLSGGVVEDAWEAHVTAFTRVPDELQGNGPRHTGVAALGEKRLGADENAAVGLQGRAGFGDEDRLYLIGGTGKYWLEGAKLLFMGELDVGYQDFTFGPAGRPQLATWLGARYFPFQGLMAGASVESFDEDLTVKDVARNAGEITVNYFPWAHWEVSAFGKLEFQGEFDHTSTSAMIQLHYYL